jgi:enamine deaminase RidA (YjgF/YER057c/UK114 family)
MRSMLISACLLLFFGTAFTQNQKAKPDSFKRTAFKEMQLDIAKTLTVGKLVFMSGTEAMEMKDGKFLVPPDMNGQIEVVVRKMNDTLKEIGLTIGNMVKHTIYMKKGSADPGQVIRKFHDECYKYAPELRNKPSTGTLAIVEGLTVDSFLIEVDAIAAYPD